MHARFAIAAIVIAGCAAYDPIQPDVCGNGVVEGNEDCDILPGAPGAATCVTCRWTCTDAACPAGYGCGADGECRKPTDPPRYTPLATPAPEQVSDFQLADLDGDGWLDAYGFGSDRAWAELGDGATFHPGLRLTRSSEFGAPAFGDLDGDGAPDLVSGGALAVVIARSGVPGGFAQVPEPFFTVPEPSFRALPLRTDVSAPFASLVTVEAAGDQLVVQLLASSGQTQQPIEIPIPPGQPFSSLIATPVQLDGDAADELALGWNGSSDLLIFATVVDAANDVRLVQVADLAVPVGPRVRAGDVDGDGVPDLVVDDPGGDFWKVRGLGNLTFAAPVRQTLPASPLANVVLDVGDLDGDGLADYVYEGGIALDRGNVVDVVAPSSNTWTDAAIADLNGDGYPDVVAATGGGLEVMLGGALGLFSRREVPIAPAPVQIRIGDLDGDRRPDVVITATTSTGKAHLEARYGNGDGTFGDGTTIADFDQLDAAEPALFERSLVPLTHDDTTDLILVYRDAAHPEMANLSYLFGSADRAPSSPIPLGGSPSTVAVGHFSANRDATRDLLILPGSASDFSAAFEAIGDGATQFTYADLHVLVSPTIGCGVFYPDPPRIAVGDLDEDGVDEIVASTCADHLRVLAMTGTDQAPELQDVYTLPIEGGGVAQLALADLDGDGHVDLVASNGAGEIAVYWGDGTALSANPSTAVLEGADRFGIGDLEGSGRQRVLLSRASRIETLDIDANRQLTASAPIVNASGIARAGDFDRDGVVDLVVGAPDGLQVFRAATQEDEPITTSAITP